MPKTVPENMGTTTDGTTNGILPTVPVRVQWIEEDVPPWKHLVRQPESWRKQLYIRGRRMTARHLIGWMLANKMTPEEVAADFDLPVGAAYEAIAYYEQNQELVDREVAEENAYRPSREVKR